MARGASDAGGAGAGARLAWPDLIAGGAASLTETLVAHGFAIISLTDFKALTVTTTLQQIGDILEPLHGCTPRIRHHTGVETSTWSRRTLLRYNQKTAPQNGEETPSLAAAAAAASEVAPILLQITRMLTNAMQCIGDRRLTDGQLDVFYYPNDEHDTNDDIFDDRDCPCPEHTDPGIVTLVAERGANALEARDAATGEWQRVTLQPHEVCLIAGSQLAKLSDGALAACVHRVAPTAAPRASYVFEVHLHVEDEAEEEDVEEAQVEEEAADAVCSDGIAVRVRRRSGGERAGARLGERAARLLSWLRALRFPKRKP